jgi:anti-anti-sigma factor
MSTPAQVSTRRGEDGVALVTARGEFDLRTADLLKQALVDALGQGQPNRLIVDVGGVTFMDSMGLRALVGGYRIACRQNTRFAVANPSAFMHYKLEAVGLTEILGLSSGTDRADATVRQSAGALA